MVSKSNNFKGVLAVGIFAENPEPLDTTQGLKGLLNGEYINLKMFRVSSWVILKTTKKEV